MENKKEMQKIEELGGKNERFSKEITSLFEEMYAAKDYGWGSKIKECEEEFRDAKRQIDREILKRKSEIEEQRMEEGR